MSFLSSFLLFLLLVYTFIILIFRDENFGGLKPSDITSGILPLFHVFGIHMILVAFAAQTTCVVIQKFVPDVFLRSIQTYRVNKLALVPPLVVFLAKSPLVEEYDLSSIEEIVCGGSNLKKDIQKLAKDR